MATRTDSPTRLSGGQPAGAQGGGRQRRRRRLSRLSQRHQRAQLRRPQFRRQGDGRRHPLRPPARAQGADGDQHLCPARALRRLAASGRQGRRSRRRRRDPRRRRPARLRQPPPSAAAPAPLGAGLGDQLRGDQFLPREVRHPARRAAARADPGPGRDGDPQHAGRDRGLRLRQPVRDERGPLLAVVLRHGESPNTVGACSPAKFVQWERSPDRDGRAPQRHPDRPLRRRRAAGYPTLCKGRFEVAGETYYALEEPTSLNVLEILPEIMPASASQRSRSRAASAARPTSRR
jgi:hypothetical protein